MNTLNNMEECMTFSLILLGVLFILITFNVGESVYKKLKLRKRTLLILIGATIILYFMPNLKISGITFTWIGFFLPFIFSVIALIKVRNLKSYFKIFVCMLIAFALGMVYNLMTFDVYEANILQPYLVLGLIIGILPLILSPNASWLYSANFIGITLAEIVFYMSRYSIYGEYYLTLGSIKVFSVLLVGFVAGVIVHFFAIKIKAYYKKKKLDKIEKEERLSF